MNITDLTPTRSEPGAPTGEGTIPLCAPEIRGNEWKYIKECLDTSWVSSAGLFVDCFERELADYVGTKYAVATCNGTAALHIALLVTGVQPDDEVLVSTLTFAAPANAIRYIGAWPIFIDAEPDYWQMDPQKVVNFLEKECQWRNDALYNKTTARRVKAILPVHILGHPVDMDLILNVARKYNLVVIEDATESLGAKYRGRMVGRLGDVACFSFNGNKIITAGGGGMIVTDNETWARRAKYLTTQAKDDPVEYVHNEIGYNYRLTNIQAAMGCAQLELLDEYIQAKRNIAARYAKALVDVPGITLMPEAEWAFSIFWMYTVLVDKVQYGMDSRRLLRRFSEAGVQTRPLWQPLHLSPAHAGSQSYLCEIADRLNQQGISLPCSVGLRAESQDRLIELIRQNHSF
jgi:perosamine synthetase